MTNASIIAMVTVAASLLATQAQAFQSAAQLNIKDPGADDSANFQLVRASRGARSTGHGQAASRGWAGQHAVSRSNAALSHNSNGQAHASNVPSPGSHFHSGLNSTNIPKSAFPAPTVPANRPGGATSTPSGQFPLPAVPTNKPIGPLTGLNPKGLFPSPTPTPSSRFPLPTVPTNKPGGPLTGVTPPKSLFPNATPSPVPGNPGTQVTPNTIPPPNHTVIPGPNPGGNGTLVTPNNIPPPNHTVIPGTTPGPGAITPNPGIGSTPGPSSGVPSPGATPSPSAPGPAAPQPNPNYQAQAPAATTPVCVSGAWVVDQKQQRSYVCLSWYYNGQLFTPDQLQQLLSR